MPEKISIVNTVTFAASASGYLSVYRPTAGRKAVVKKFKACFPPGSENYLHVAIYHGIRQAIPRSGAISGDGVCIEVEAEEEYLSEEEVKLWYNNTDTVNSRTVTYILEIELTK